MMIEGAIEILLVEDNLDDVRLTVDALHNLNITNPVGVVRDGAEALDFLLRTGPYAGRENHSLKLILLDLKLPKVDGHDVLRRIKSNPDTQMIPVVVFTSSREERDIIKSYRLGTNGYVVKPIDYQQIIEAVEQLGVYWLVRNEPP
jgi:two-component system response regulator